MLKSIRKIQKQFTHLNKLNSRRAGPHLIHKTPLELNTRLSKKYGVNVFFKREDLQPIRSFKIRGAAAMISSLSRKEKKQGVVCASAGNHAQGVAQVCACLEIPVDVFVPEITPMQKIQRIESLVAHNSHGHLHRSGKSLANTLESAVKFSIEQNKSFIHPFDNDNIIFGQGTVAEEIYNQLQEHGKTPNTILSSIGGGGLISGISLYSSVQEGNCRIVGIEPETCPSMTVALQQGVPTEVPCFDDFVDGASVSKVGEKTFDICRRMIDPKEVHTVEVGHLCTVILEMYQEDGIIVEPAGALSVAGLDILSEKHMLAKNQNIVCVISGGNNDVARYPEIIERSLQWKQLKHYFFIEFGQTPGELLRWVKTVLGPTDDITRFEYIKKSDKEKGTVLVGVQVKRKEDFIGIEQRMVLGNFSYQKLDEVDLVVL